MISPFSTWWKVRKKRLLKASGSVIGNGRIVPGDGLARFSFKKTLRP